MSDISIKTGLSPDSGNLSKATAPGPPTGAPEEVDVALFKRLSGDGQGQGALPGQGDPKGDLLKDDLPGEKAVLYDSGDGEAPPSEMLSSLLSRSLGSLSQAGPGSVEAAQQAETPAASDLAEKLVSRILVSSPDSAGQEARLMVDPALLADTEIRLTRGPDGFLSVNLITSDQNALQALVEARGSLESALSRTEGPAFRVTVEDSRADAQGGGEQQGRSKGLDFADEPQ